MSRRRAPAARRSPPARGARARGAAAAAPPGRHEVRIIGGTWRGRKLCFPRDVPELRPTPDRVRETLFNWLRDVIAGRRCLDLYAGSGALGFEALSRGAREVVFVERDARVARYLADSLGLLADRRGVVQRDDAIEFLRGFERADEPFDVIFLDPPYRSDALREVCALIDARGWLRPGGHAYLEHPASDDLPALPAGWTVFRSGRAGGVGYHLVRTAVVGAAPPAPADGPA
jgi:16S rRNA (guanine966-N2)-methyltransferase